MTSSIISNIVVKQLDNTAYALLAGVSFLVGAALIYPLAIYVFDNVPVLKESFSTFLVTSVVFIFTSFIKNKKIVADSVLLTIEIVALLFLTTILTPKLTSLLFDNYYPSYSSVLIHGVVSAIIAFSIKSS